MKDIENITKRKNFREGGLCARNQFQRDETIESENGSGVNPPQTNFPRGTIGLHAAYEGLHHPDCG